MAQYKKLLSERAFLKVQQRARALNGTDISQIFYKNKEVLFKTISGTDHKTIWTQRIVIFDINDVDISGRAINVSKEIRDSNLKVNCNCPAFLYWGYKYIAWRTGYGIEKETRRPKVRNPQQKGFVCKHLFQVMQVYPFVASHIVKELKKEQDKLIKKAEK